MNDSIYPSIQGKVVEQRKEVSAIQINAFIWLFYLLNVPMIIVGLILFLGRKLMFWK